MTYAAALAAVLALATTTPVADAEGASIPATHVALRYVAEHREELGLMPADVSDVAATVEVRRLRGGKKK